MLEMLSITGPIYLTISIGAASVRFALFSKSDMRVIGKLVINLALPCLLFNVLSHRKVAEIIRFDYLAGYALGTLAVIAFGFIWAGRFRAAMRQMARRLLTNPLILALFFGLTAALLELRLPAPLDRTVTMFAQASSALSLLVIGGRLVGLPLQGMAQRVLPVVAGKLFLHPLLVMTAFAGLALVGFVLPTEMRQAGILLAAMPVMSIYPILAQRHGMEGDAAATLLLSTLASFISLNLLIATLHAGWL